MADKDSFDLVVIGSSAGGIDALITLVASLPRDFPAPIVIAQHLDPGRPSRLEEILARRASLPVHTVVDRERLSPGAIIVVPADRDIAVTDHELSLRAERREGPKPSVDLLLSSAANVFGERLIAVILTGLGSDGAAGARVVSAAGGTVIIQNPATASYPAMPLSLAPTTVDVVADLEGIGPLLSELLAGTYAPTRADEERILRTFLDDLRQRSGIDFASYRRPTIVRRLRRRMAAAGVTDLREYIRHLHRHPEEYQRLASSFLIKVTEFYRDADLFDELRQQILPAIVRDAAESGREVRVWSAGCATGEEAYSLAMVLYEVVADELRAPPIRVFATDLDGQAVAYARRGVYPPSAVSTLPPELIARHFVEHDGEYEIKKHLRAMTVFGQHDLAQRAPFPRIDLVLCRNVLMYFTAELQRRALHLFAFSLRDGGYLVLGKAETTSPLPEFFALTHSKLKVYRRQGARLVLPEPRLARLLDAPRTFPTASLLRSSRACSPMLDVDVEPPARLDANELPVPMVVIDASYDVISVNPAARRLLGIHGTAIGEDLLHIARVPTDPLRRLIDQAIRGRPAIRATLDVSEDDSPTGERLSLEALAYPRPASAGRVQSVVLIFNELVPEPLVEDDRPEAALREPRELSARHFERISKRNDELHGANEQLLQTNEELASRNEELFVVNEEVQAATEEVETLNEELQASNEELETLNEELQATVEELDTTNDDLQARSLELQELAVSLERQREASEFERQRVQTVLTNMADAVVVVKRDGSPLLTNPAYEALFNSSVSIVDENGAPFSLGGTPEARAARGEPFTVPFRVIEVDGSQRWFEAKGQPVTLDGEEAGIVLFRDISERSLRLLQEEFIALASHELRTPLTALQAYVQLLGRRPEIRREPRLSTYVDTALAEAKRLTALITELSEATRLQGGRLELDRRRVNLADLVERVIDISQSLTETQVIRYAKPDPVVVSADPGRLEQVVLNLISNAITHAPKSPFIDVALERRDSAAVLTVRDDGPGVPRSDLPYLFTRFYQVSRERGGSEHGLGLGLYISREIVRAHGGDIEVSSEEGHGSTFTVTIPLTARGDSAKPSTESKKPASNPAESDGRSSSATDGPAVPSGIRGAGSRGTRR